MSKLQEENTERLDNLYRYSHKWLIGAAFKISKNLEVANELVSDLYLYLGERLNTAIWFDDPTGRKTFNLLYLRAFLQTRFLNRIKASKKNFPLKSDYVDIADEEYDYDFEDRVNNSYKDMLTELDNLKTTRLWAPAKLFEIYAFTEGMTLDKLADEIGICRSTAFGNTKKIKLHLRNKISNPFKPAED